MFIHEKAICESIKIGQGTRVWAFAHILPDAEIGSDCNICDGVFIENDVTIGNRVTIKCGVQLWDGIIIHDEVFIGPNVTFSNDKYPRSQQYPEKFAQTIVEQGASIGANATILPGVVIGKGAMVGAGSVVTSSVPPYATVIGNPARIVNYNTELLGSDIVFNPNLKEKGLSVKGCKLVKLPAFHDMRGSLVACEYDTDLPFTPKRSFLVHYVKTDKVRGEHAHKECLQFLIAVSGELSVVVDDGISRQEVRLNSPEFGLYIPNKVWGVQYKFSKDAVLMVYASDTYKDADYIRDYDEFICYVKK
ncbi:WxcM-like domain-containing protein [Vibrio diazotrophicus]|uniref:WxcM-like domain-containing protein n=1 Tax=Vibrio diazotrophicus TaxID=685 RepID=UPI0015E0780B|nr:WxcM-like domain-containing protein [Vibrio diazotrophicus]